jgi:hypothetical protein
MGLFSFLAARRAPTNYIPLPTLSSEPSPPSSPRARPRASSLSLATDRAPAPLASARRVLAHLSLFRLVVLAVFLLTAGHWYAISSSSSGAPSSTAADDPAPDIADDKWHRVFADASPGAASADVLPFRVYDRMSDACVREWVIAHRWGPACRGTDLSEGLVVDGVWAWVNGSYVVSFAPLDALNEASTAIQRRYSRGEHTSPLPRRSKSTPTTATRTTTSCCTRCALSSPLSGRTSCKGVPSILFAHTAPCDTDARVRQHIMASAYPLGNETVGNGTRMSGQIPAWLSKPASLRTDDGAILLHHGTPPPPPHTSPLTLSPADSDFFQPLPIPPNTSLSAADVAAWRRAVLPSFNSLAVESQLANTPAPRSDTLVYLNDDFLTLRPNRAADYTSPLFGPVLRSLTDLGSLYHPSEYPFQRLWNPAGEEVGIKRAAWVLGRRFGMRAIPYIQHHPRTLARPLLREVATAFPAAFGDTARARYRAQQDVPPSVQPFALASWFVVQRHREALLWAWAVARHGALAGTLTPETKDRMWAELGGDARGGSLAVRAPAREPVENTGAFVRAAQGGPGLRPPLNTQYSFSSKDGYALHYIDRLWWWDRPRAGYPDLTRAISPASSSSSAPARNADGSLRYDARHGSRLRLCTLRRACLAPREAEPAAALFARIAFADAACGDCAIAALVGASGLGGIAAFVPGEDAPRVPPGFVDAARVPVRPVAHKVAHLPATSDWRETDFSLAAVLANAGYGTEEVDLRTWTARLIQRYQYTMGSAPAELFKLMYPDKVRARLDRASAEMRAHRAQVAAHALALDALDAADGFRRGQADGAPDAGLTFLCLNDDIVTGRREIDGMLRAWFDEHWPDRMDDEVDGEAEAH